MQQPIGTNAAQPGLLAEMVLTAQAYGARMELAPTIAKECALLVARKFPQLAIPEIREAYRQWASGQTHPEGADMYGGSFNAAQLGKVLTAYCSRRDRIAADIRRAYADEQEAMRQAATAEAQRQTFAKTFPLKFQALRTTATTWQDVPLYIFDVLYRRRLITVTPEYTAETLVRAEAIAKQQIEEERLDNRARFISINQDARITNIAKRLATWELAVNNPDFQLPENITEILLDGQSRRA
jgi:hypothetical protein